MDIPNPDDEDYDPEAEVPVKIIDRHARDMDKALKKAQRQRELQLVAFFGQALADAKKLQAEYASGKRIRMKDWWGANDD